MHALVHKILHIAHSLDREILHISNEGDDGKMT